MASGIAQLYGRASRPRPVGESMPRLFCANSAFTEPDYGQFSQPRPVTVFSNRPRLDGHLCHDQLLQRVTFGHKSASAAEARLAVDGRRINGCLLGTMSACKTLLSPR